jgi:hypothetical protein
VSGRRPFLVLERESAVVREQAVRAFRAGTPDVPVRDPAGAGVAQIG